VGDTFANIISDQSETLYLATVNSEIVLKIVREHMEDKEVQPRPEVSFNQVIGQCPAEAAKARGAWVNY
jgi:hypothetical protein